MNHIFSTASITERLDLKLPYCLTRIAEVILGGEGTEL